MAASALWGRQRHRAMEIVEGESDDEPLSVQEHALLETRLRPVDGIDLVYVGHTILTQRKPLLVGNTLFVDTGAYLASGRLTLVEPLADRYWQVASGAALKVMKGGPRKLPTAAAVSPDPGLA